MGRMQGSRACATRVVSAVVLACVVLAWGGCAGPARSSGGRGGPVVAIVRGKDVDAMVAEALDLLGGVDEFARDGQHVVIKPNLTWQPGLEQRRWGEPPRPQITTDVRIVEALARQMLGAAECTVTVAEGTSMGVEQLYEFLGYDEMARKLGIDLVNVELDERVPVQVDGYAMQEYNMPAVTQNSDVLVDVAVLKTHNLAGVTLGMKNLYGLLEPPRNIHHGHVHEVICDLSLARKPDLVVIDGLVAMEGDGPIEGDPVEMDLIIAGRDIVAVDAVCTAIMGFDPTKVKHLRLAAQKGVGEIDLARIRVKGLQIESVRRPFKSPVGQAEVPVRRTEDVLRKVFELAGRDGGGRSRWRVDVAFGRDTLQEHVGDYPLLAAQGFRARTGWRGDRIVFSSSYELLGDEEGRAIRGELRKWIESNLGADAEFLQ